MAILNDCEIYFAKLDPAKPSPKMNPKNPTWEIQIRTKSKAQATEWKEHGLRVTPVREDDDGPVLYYRANLRKKSIKADGEDGKAPDVIDGDMNKVDPNSIGNASVGNVRIFQYDYTDRESGQKGKASVLMGVQLTKHILYVPKPRNDDDDFSKTTTVRIQPPAEDGAEAQEGAPAPAEGKKEDFSKGVDADEIF